MDESADETPLECLAQHGFCWVRQALSSQQLDHARSRIETILTGGGPGVLASEGQPYGVRNLLELWPDVVELLSDRSLLDFLQQVMGPKVYLVRALFFDKPPAKSWTLPWHRDRTIAVANLPDFDRSGFSNPTRKAGILHVIAPNDLLSRMLTLRISLDPMREENGTLRVLPGSHRLQDATDEDLNSLVQSSVLSTQCEAGDVFVMRPLLAHSSGKSADKTPLRRRVIHLELSEKACPGVGVDWHRRVPIPM